MVPKGEEVPKGESTLFLCRCSRNRDTETDKELPFGQEECPSSSHDPFADDDASVLFMANAGHVRALCSQSALLEIGPS